MGECARLIKVKAVDHFGVRQRNKVFEPAPAASGADFINNPGVRIEFADCFCDVDRHLTPFDRGVRQLRPGQGFIEKIISPQGVTVRCQPFDNACPVTDESFFHSGNFPHLFAVQFAGNLKRDRNHFQPGIARLPDRRFQAVEKNGIILFRPGQFRTDAPELQPHGIGIPVVRHIPERLPAAQTARHESAHHRRIRLHGPDDRRIGKGFAGPATFPVLLDRGTGRTGRIAEESARTTRIAP